MSPQETNSNRKREVIKVQTESSRHTESVAKAPPLKPVYNPCRLCWLWRWDAQIAEIECGEPENVLTVERQSVKARFQAAASIKWLHFGTEQSRASSTELALHTYRCA
jgi:hypothetical protein